MHEITNSEKEEVMNMKERKRGIGEDLEGEQGREKSYN